MAKQAGFSGLIRRVVRTGALVLLVVMALTPDLVPASSAGAAGPVAQFDWRMPDRYGIDTNGDGLIDVNPDANFIFPSTWPVTLDACASDGGGSAITQYAWRISGPGISGAATQNATACSVVYPFPLQGAYTVVLTVTNALSQTAVKTLTVVVKDWLIVSMGDSVGSGEGNPDIPAPSRPDNTPLWADQRCHRSRWAGASIASLVLEHATPHTSVTFLHLACSGATITEGILGPYAGQEPAADGSLLPPQLTQLSTLFGQAHSLGRALRPVDALLMSIGANDTNWVDATINCVLIDHCYVDVLGRPDSLEGWKFFQDGMAALDVRYPQMTATFSTAGALLPPDRIFPVEYPDLLRDDAGNFCDNLLSFPGFFNGLTADEAQWADTTFLAGLNGRVQAKSTAAGWSFIGGMVSAFRTHGYCAANHWIVKLEEALAVQNSYKGMFHPNALGQAAEAQAMVQALANHPGFVPPGVLSSSLQPLLQQQAGKMMTAAAFGDARMLTPGATAATLTENALVP